VTQRPETQCRSFERLVEAGSRQEDDHNISELFIKKNDTIDTAGTKETATQEVISTKESMAKKIAALPCFATMQHESSNQNAILLDHKYQHVHEVINHASNPDVKKKPAAKKKARKTT